MELTNRRILITGGTSGIGLELARRLAGFDDPRLSPGAVAGAVVAGEIGGDGSTMGAGTES